MLKNNGVKMAAVALVLMLIIAGCQTTTTRGTSGAAIGAATGAIAGQAIGRSTKGTLLGAAVGGLIGYIIGNEMDKYDQARLNDVYESAPSGQRSQWVNPDTQRSYEVTPRPAYTKPSGQVCREAEILATINGKPEKVVSLACRDSEGRWVIQK